MPSTPKRIYGPPIISRKGIIYCAAPHQRHSYLFGSCQWCSAYQVKVKQALRDRRAAAK